MLDRPPGGATILWVERRGMWSSIWVPGQKNKKMIISVSLLSCFLLLTLHWSDYWPEISRRVLVSHLRGWIPTGGDFGGRSGFLDMGAPWWSGWVGLISSCWWHRGLDHRSFHGGHREFRPSETGRNKPPDYWTGGGCYRASVTNYLSAAANCRLPCYGLWSSCTRHQEKPSWEWSVLNLRSRWVFRPPEELVRRWSPPMPLPETPNPQRCWPLGSAHRKLIMMRSFEEVWH